MALLLLIIMVLVVMVEILGVVHCFPTGAPDLACDEMVPFHPADTAKGPSPFAMTVDFKYYKPGSEITGVIYSTTGEFFRGVLIEARSITGNQSALLGTFIPPSGQFRTTCSGKAMTHANKNDKQNVTFTWAAPENSKGDIIFRFTNVHSYDPSVYWTNSTSPVIQDCTLIKGPLPDACNDLPTEPPSFEPPTEPPLTSPSVPSGRIPNDPECGKTKGCTPDCRNGGCQFLITWQDVGGKVMFEIHREFVTPGRKWAAIGFSSNNRMGDTSVVSCLYQDGPMSVEMSFNENHQNKLMPNKTLGLQMITASYNEQKMYCKFTRMTSMPEERDKIFDLKNDWFIIHAYGDVDDQGVKQKHDTKPEVTSVKADFQEKNILGVNDSPNLMVTIHASLMLAAWICFTSIGIVTARFCKDMWERTLFSKAVWFQIHRTCMSLTLLCTVGSFIVIFVEVGGYSDIQPRKGRSYTKAHPILGIFITFLTLANPIMALCRPHPDADRRPIFNWAHRTVGFTALLASAVNIFFGFDLDVANVPIEAKYVLLAYVGTFLVIEITLELHSYMQTHEKDESIDNKKASDPLLETSFTDYNSSNNSSNLLKRAHVQRRTKKNSGFRELVYLVHVLSMAGFATALIIIVVGR